MKAKNGEIETDKKFSADDDWLQGLSVRISNRSAKPITFVELLIVFWRSEDQTPGRSAGWTLKVGIDPFEPEISRVAQTQAVVPGDEIELTLSDNKYRALKRFLKAFQFPDKIKKVELKVIVVGFDDDTAWNSGRMFRRDPKSTKGPLRGWTL